MKFPVRRLSVLVALLCTSMLAGGATVTPLFQKPLADLNREGLMVVVDLAAGEASSEHRHNAHTFVYVLEGSVVMQVEGSEPQVLEAGEVFYETPDDIHTVSRNASTTEAAKILVFFVKQPGAPATVAAD